MSHPQRILEVTINSARDLPPMAKMLRTFVVAWVDPDTKLSTRVDHHGHTNPTWNDKLSFRVDDDFLRSESSSVMMVIYNLAWLRDLPMGTANLNIGQILKNLMHKNHALRNITLRIKRPTGQLQGTLNVSVNIVGYPLPTSTPGTQLLTASKTPSKEFNQPKQESFSEKFGHLEWDSNIGVENKRMNSKHETLSEVFDHLKLERKIGVGKEIRQPKQEPSSEETLSEVFAHLDLERNIGVSRHPKQETSPEKTLPEVFDTLDLERKLGVEKNKTSLNETRRKTVSGTNSMRDSYNADISSLGDSTLWNQPSESGTKTQTKTISSNDSLFPQTKSFPTEVASDMKKGYFSHSPGSSKCNNLFENWSEAQQSSERKTWMSKSPRRGVDHQLNNMLFTTNIAKNQKPKPKPRNKSSNDKGLLSCFGNLKGFQFKILCGSKNAKKKKLIKSDDPIFTTKQNLRSFQF